MNTLIHADVFFFITSIAVVFVSAFLIIALYYFISMLRRLRNLSEKLKENIGEASEDVQEMAEQIKESPIFNFLFPKKRKKKKKAD